MIVSLGGCAGVAVADRSSNILLYWESMHGVRGYCGGMVIACSGFVR